MPYEFCLRVLPLDPRVAGPWFGLQAPAGLRPAAARCAPRPVPRSFDIFLGPELDGSTVYTAITVYHPTTATGHTLTENILAAGDVFALSELDDTGNLLSTFINPTIGNGNRTIYTIVPAQNGVFTDPSRPLVYIGGLFGKTFITDKDRLPAQNVKRMTLDGVIDNAFDVGTGADDNYVTALVPLNDASASLVACGLFTTFNKQSYPRVVRLTTTGAISSDFAPVPVNDNVFAAAAQIDPALGTPDPAAPQFLIGGTFTAIGSTGYTKLARINYDGSVDTSFKPVIDERVLAVATQPDGKIIIGGQFAVVNGQSVGHLARLNADGSLDTTFNASVSVIPQDTATPPVAVYVINLLPDGRMYVGGNFYAADGVSRRYLARLNADGSLDASFDPGDVITNSVQTIATQRDNRVIAGETVNKKINNIFPPSLVRLFGDVETVDAAVTVAATKPDARTGTGTARKNGVVTFTRSGASDAASLNFYFTATGTAQQGSAFHKLKATNVSGNLYQATFPAGAATLALKVKTLGTVLSDSPESLTFTVEPSPDASALYNMGSGLPTAATVKIRNP